MKSMPVYYFMVGIPCSGKTYFAKNLARKTGAVIVCPDDIRVSERVRSERAFEIAREQIASNLREGRNVIFDATNTIARWRTQNILAGKQFASLTVAFVMRTELQWCLNRNAQRSQRGERSGISKDVIIRMQDQLGNNLPRKEEGFDAIFEYSGIKLTMLNGEFTGQSRYVYGDYPDSPEDILKGAIVHGWKWEIDYRGATPEEAFLWHRADLVCRTARAFDERRLLYFQGVNYKSLQEIENATGIYFEEYVIDKDDETGLYLVTKRTYPEALCQFCKNRVDAISDPDSAYECNNCGAEYWTEDAGDVDLAVLQAEERGYEVKILKDYDFSEGVRVHLIFVKSKEACYGAD